MDSYHCNFCPGPQIKLGRPHRTRDGKCVIFADGCFAADLTRDESCWPDAGP
jgi:hypothetical protein